MVTGVDLLRDEIAQYCADKNIRWEVLAATHAGIADRGSQAIGHKLGKGAGILVGENPRHCPCRSGVFRGKGGAARLEERPAAVTLEWSFAAQRILQSFNHHQTVHHRFTGKKPSLAPVVVMANAAQQPESSGPSNQCSESRVRKRVVVTDRILIVREVLADVAVCHE